MKCCINCQERTITCHATCEKYLSAVKEYREKKAIVNRNRKMDILLNQSTEFDKMRTRDRKRELERSGIERKRTSKS